MVRVVRRVRDFPYTAQEDQTIIDAVNEGECITDLSRRMDRSESAIKDRARVLRRKGRLTAFFTPKTTSFTADSPSEFGLDPEAITARGGADAAFAAAIGDRAFRKPVSAEQDRIAADRRAARTYTNRPAW